MNAVVVAGQQAPAVGAERQVGERAPVGAEGVLDAPGREFVALARTLAP